MDLIDYGSSSEEEQSPKQLDDSEPSSAHSSEDEESLKEYQEPTPSPKKEPASPPEIEPVEPKILPVHFDGLPPSPPGQCSENVAVGFNSKVGLYCLIAFRTVSSSYSSTKRMVLT